LPAVFECSPGGLADDGRQIEWLKHVDSFA
jgi:hypothetical protein